MYSNDIVNFQESMTIVNASTKKSGKLLKAPRKSWKEVNLPNRLTDKASLSSLEKNNSVHFFVQIKFEFIFYQIIREIFRVEDTILKHKIFSGVAAE